MDYITKIDLADVLCLLEIYHHDDPENPTESQESKKLVAKLERFFRADSFDQEEAREVLAELYGRYGEIVETYMEVDYSGDHNRLARWRELSERLTRDHAVAIVRRLRTEFYQWKLENASLSMDPDDYGKISIGLKIEHDGKQCELWCSGLEIQFPEEA